MPDGRTVVRSFRIVERNYFEQVQRMEMDYDVTWPDGRVEHRASRFLMRYLFRFEAEHLLVREGFEVEALYGDYQRHGYGQTAYPGDLVFVCRKARGS
jgi:hypothetical protein